MPSPKEKIRDSSLRFFLSERTAATQATCLLTSKVENVIYFLEKNREAQIARLAFIVAIFMHALADSEFSTINGSHFFVFCNLWIKISGKSFVLFIHYSPDDTGI